MSLRTCAFFCAFVLSATSAAGTPIILPEKFEAVNEAALKPGPCAGEQAAMYCRNFPWVPKPDEGAFGSGSLITLVVRNEIPPEHELKKILFGVLDERRLETFALMILSSDGMIRAVNQSGFTNILVLFRNTDSPPKTIAAFIAPRTALQNFTSGLGKEWRKTLPDAVGWEPPKEFAPFYQFETF